MIVHADRDREVPLAEALGPALLAAERLRESGVPGHEAAVELLVDVGELEAAVVDALLLKFEGRGRRYGRAARDRAARLAQAPASPPRPAASGTGVPGASVPEGRGRVTCRRELSMHYSVRAPRPTLDAAWDDPAWAARPWLEIASFRAEGSEHRPRTRARLAYDDDGLAGIFRVEDRYVRSVHTRFGEPVYRDSCVEVFLQPKPDRGYLNFEMNAGGALLASHITDHRRTPDGFAAWTRLTADDGARVSVRSTLPAVVAPEVQDPVDWQLAFLIPVALLERYVGPIGRLAGQRWRANLYKCGDDTSHPHWASWSPVDSLNFHLPHCFGTLVYEP